MKPNSIDQEARRLDLQKDGRELRSDFKRTKIAILIAIVVVLLGVVALLVVAR